MRLSVWQVIEVLPGDLLVPRIHRVRSWQTVVVDDDLGSRLERGDQVLEEFLCILVGPVVEDPPEEVHIGVLDRLLSEEIVRLELNPVGQLGRNL